MFAPDSAYINQCERDPDYQEMEWSYSLAMSHAVVDSIAAEAIDVIRLDPTLDHSCDLEEWNESCNECRFVRKARAVVKRFDNLTKNKEQ